MEQHPNARLTPRGRETLVSRIESGLGVAETARQMASAARRRASGCAAAGPESPCPTAVAARAGSRGPRRARSRTGSARRSSSLPLAPPGWRRARYA